MIVGFLPGYFIHRQIFNQEKIIWNYVSEMEDITEQYGVMADSLKQMKLPEETIDSLPPFYMDLIKIHEEFRRNNFGRFSNQDDELIANFIAAPNQALIKAFNTKPNISSEKSNLWDAICSNVFFLMVLFLVLIWLFKMIMVLGNKIYLIDYHFTNAFGLLPEGVEKQDNSFVIGVDAAKSRDWVLQQFGWQSEELLLVSLSRGEEMEMPEIKPIHKGVILENFHCLEDTNTLLSTMIAFQKNYGRKGLGLFVTSGRPLQEILPNEMSKQSKLLITEIFSDYLFQYVPIDFDNQKIMCL